MDSMPGVTLHSLYYISAVLAATISAECPRSALKQAQLCTASLGIGPPRSSQPSAFVAMGQLEKAKKACRGKELSKAVDCLQTLTDACQGNTEQEYFLRMMINVTNTRHSVTYFCDNLKVYEDNALCIAEQHEEQKKCTLVVKREFQTKVKATSNMDVMMRSTCRFYEAAVTCSSKIFKLKCGEEAANVVVTMLKGFQPPVCFNLHTDPKYKVTETDGSGSSQSPQTTHITNILLSFCALVHILTHIDVLFNK